MLLMKVFTAVDIIRMVVMLSTAKKGGGTRFDGRATHFNTPPHTLKHVHIRILSPGTKPSEQIQTK